MKLFVSVFVLFLCVDPAFSVNTIPVPAFWTDAEGCDCGAYATQTSTCANSAPVDVNNIVNFARFGIHATDACPACGGGSSNSDLCAFAGDETLTSLGVDASGLVGECLISDSNPSCKITQCTQSTGAKNRASGEAEITCTGGALYLASNSLECTSCSDYPAWEDSDGFSCDDYHRFDLCRSRKRYGAGWLENPALSPYGFHSYPDNNKVDAAEACCACGGGTILEENNNRNATTERTVTKTEVENIGTNPSLDSPKMRMAHALRVISFTGDPAVNGVFNKIIHAFLYYSSWLLFAGFAVRTSLRLPGADVWGLSAALGTAIYLLFNYLAGKSNVCEIYERQSFGLGFAAVLLLLTGRVRSQMESIMEYIVARNEMKDKAQQQAARLAAEFKIRVPEIDNDVDDTVLSVEGMRVAGASSLLQLNSGTQSRDKNDEKGGEKKKKESVVTKLLKIPSEFFLSVASLLLPQSSNKIEIEGYGIDQELRTVESSSIIRPLTLIGSFLILLSISYLWFGCSLFGVLSDLSYGSATRQTGTVDGYGPNLAVGASTLTTLTKRNEDDVVDAVELQSACSRTTPDADPRWHVDLGDEFTIQEIFVRGGCADHDSLVDGPETVRVVVSRQTTNGATEKLVGASCASAFTLNKTTRSKLECRNTPGRYVTVMYDSVSADKRRLCLCEVSVIGTKGKMNTNAPAKQKPQSREWGCTLA